jgi:hypothetical protein
MTALEDVRRDYRAAFVGYLPRRLKRPCTVGMNPAALRWPIA